MRSLSGSGGYGTGEGIKVTGSWTHRNLLPDEGALILDAVAGTQQQGASATFPPVQRRPARPDVPGVDRCGAAGFRCL